MDTLWYALGAAVVSLGLLDVFLTVVHYDSRGLSTQRANRAIWRLVRWVTAPLPKRAGQTLRTVGGPLMVVLMLVGWLAAVVVGFALLYLPGVTGGAFSLSLLPHTFPSALYFSAASLTSLSFSDAEPKTLGFHSLAALETLIGLAVLTLAISYILGLYRVLTDQGILAMTMHHEARDTSNPRTILASHFLDGRPKGISTLVRELHQNLTEHSEGMHRYPAVYYFHIGEAYRSVPYLLWFIGVVAAALRWGLPEGHPARSDPWLPGLLAGFNDVVEELTRGFIRVGPDEKEPAEPVPFDRFADGRRNGVDPEREEGLASFFDLECLMCDLARLGTLPDEREAYERYREWAAFRKRTLAFVRAASIDLGLEPPALGRRPSAGGDR